MRILAACGTDLAFSFATKIAFEKISHVRGL